jgi:hypothetical protein
VITMSQRLRPGRLMVCLLAASAAVAATGVEARATSGAAPVQRCGEAIFGVAGPGAQAVAGSADPQVVASLSILRRPRTAADALPAVPRLGRALSGAGAATYDPAASVRLGPFGTRGGLYALPATLSAQAATVACRGIPGSSAYLQMQADLSGTGPGACLVATSREQVRPATGPPGAPRPGPTLTVTGVRCESSPVLAGYVGTLADAALGGPSLMIDGVTGLSYLQSSGQTLAATVTDNLFTAPEQLTATTGEPTGGPTGGTRLAEQLDHLLPVSVTELGAGGAPLATLARPAQLVADVVAGVAFESRVLRQGATTTSSSSVGGAPTCSVRTHRCVAVTLDTACDGPGHCRVRRVIHRYRYAGRHPPRGSRHTGPEPTGPIVARIVRAIRRPTRIRLALRGTAPRGVVPLESVSCSRGDGEAIAGGPASPVAVPSRSAVRLPGRSASCQVTVLVVGHPGDHVRARLLVARRPS